MKRILILSLAFLILFCSCGKKNSDSDGESVNIVNGDFNIFTIPEGTSMLILNTSTYDVIPYGRDNADVEAFLEKQGELEPDDLTTVEFIDYKDDTPFVTFYLERELTYIFKAWSFGEGECAIMLYTVGGNQPIYQLTYKSEELGTLIEKIYNDFRG